MAQNRTVDQLGLPKSRSEEMERSQCPSIETIQLAAEQIAPLDDTLHQHFAQCSACWKEFRHYRVPLEYDRFLGKTKWLLYVVLLIILGSMAFRAYHEGFSW